MPSEQAVVLVGALVISIGAALQLRSLARSLIALFYASLLLGITFTAYGAAFAGLLHIVTFAGAVSVMLMMLIRLAGTEREEPASGHYRFGIVSGALLAVSAALAYVVFRSYSGSAPVSTTPDFFGFLWLVRPWDLLALLVVLTTAMIGIANLLAKGE